MTPLTGTRMDQVESVEDSVARSGLTVHSVDTPYGTMRFTTGDSGHGEVWCQDVVTINRRDHVLIGSYTFTHEWDASSGSWDVNHGKPFLVIFGYPGLKRMDGKPDTDNARRAIGRELGRAVAPFHG